MKARVHLCQKCGSVRFERVFCTEDTTAAPFQVVSDCHSATEFSYEQTLEGAESVRRTMYELHGNAEIRERGDFVPHYLGED